MGWEGTGPIKWAAKMKDTPRDATNIFAFSVFNRVVERTPVDTGAARQNWLVTLNNQTSDFDTSKTKGGNVISEGSKTIESAKGDDTIYIQNNVPYIRKLEFGGYGDGPKTTGSFSKQAPHGMVGVVMAMAERLWNAAVKAARGSEG